ncbi:LysR substrate-binding domain-containing protein [Fodinicurvata sp. EGI_FJ10296]|uniref:LysR substrate-binding domain-containing protein n=1 Tax=Fodinicurvata sp. EGI_FJ10296 TaxID=3231908 RepID=UPI003451B006
MRHRQIEAFRAVMAARTMTEAAEYLRISQPSVSRLISDLEASLPFPLFERRHGRVSPTPEAIQMFEEVERSYKSLERLFEFARDLSNFREARLTIAAMPGLCLDLVPQTIASFQGQHPQARLALHARSSQQVVEWIISQHCELGLAAPPFDVRGVRVEMSVTAAAVCALSRGHPLTAKQCIRARDLADEKLISLTASSLRQHLETIIQSAGIDIAIQIETPLSIVACRLVELGLGVAVFDPFTALYCENRDVEIRPFEPEVPFTFGVLSAAGRSRSRGSVEFIGMLEETLNSYPVASRIERPA